jgi:hypothetical protein
VPQSRTILISLAMLAMAVALPLAVLYLMVPRGAALAEAMGVVWVFVPLAVVGAVVIAVPLIIGPARMKLLRDRAKATRWGRIAVVMLGPLFYLIAVTSMTVSNGGSVLAQALSAVPMSLVFAGLGMTSLFLVHVGKGRHCAKCAYEMDGETEAAADTNARCPECGAFWCAPGGWTIGRREKRWQFLIAGSAIAAAAFGFEMTRLSGSRVRAATLSLLPTSSLIAEVTAAPRGFTMDEWAALSKRRMTGSQELTLAEGLLEMRQRKQFLSAQAEKWIESRVLTAGLTEELRTRYFRDMLTLWIDAPDRAKAGEEVSIGIAEEEHGSLSSPSNTKLCEYVLFGGFRVNGGEPRAREDKGQYGSLCARVDRSRGKVEPAQRYGSERATPETTASRDTPGAIDVTAEYWLIVGPWMRSPSTITWNADGTPALPSGTVFAEKREIKKTIEVGP